MVKPDALALLARCGYSTQGLRSKLWDEFSAPGAPVIHLLLIVCDEFSLLTRDSAEYVVDRYSERNAQGRPVPSDTHVVAIATV